MKKVKVNEIYETSDYDMFKLSKSNRNVAYRKELFEEAKKGFIAPIVVDKNMIVIDGQSRLFHARKAEVPIKFFMDENISEKDIVRMNTTQKSWTNKDYIESYANEGNENYQKLLKLVNLNIISITALAAISMNVAMGGVTNTIVKNGTYEFRNKNTMEFLEYYKELVNQTKIPRYNTLTLAIFKVCKIKKLNRSRLIKKINQTNLRDNLVLRQNYSRYLELILEAYNHKSRSQETTIDYYITRNGEVVINEEMES